MSNRLKIILMLLIAYTAIFLLTTWSHAQTPKTATLEWNANTEPDIKAYRIYRDSLACDQLGPKQFVVEVGVVTTYVDTTIPTDATVASWNISAVNTAGDESARSNCAQKTFVAPPDQGGFIVTKIGTTTVDLTTATVSDGAGGTAKYAVRYAVAPGLTQNGWSAGTVATGCVNAGPCQIVGLVPNTTYEIQYQTVRVSDGAVGPLGPITTLTTGVVHVPPQAPKGLRVVSNPTPDTVALAWDQPGGDPAQYRVDRLNQTTGSWFAVSTVAGSVREATVPMANAGKRLYRACAIEGTTVLCEKSGVWASR